MHALHWTLTLLAALGLMACDVLDPNPGPEPGPAQRPSPSAIPEGGAGPPGGTPGGGTTGGLAQVGEGLYIQYCAVCHAADGSGTGIFNASIQGATGMRAVVQNGVGEMPAFPQLTVEDVLAMEAYLASFVDGSGGMAPVPREPQTWQEHYQVKCAACHGANGEGAPLGPQIKSPVYPYATWVTRNGRSGVGFSSVMPAYSEAELPGPMLDGILNWLAEAPKPRDGQGLNARFCANCHGSDGRGGPTRAGILGEDLDEYIETVRDGEGGRNYGDRGEYMPAWGRLDLTDADIRLIHAYLHGRSSAAQPADED